LKFHSICHLRRTLSLSPSSVPPSPNPTNYPFHHRRRDHEFSQML
jgi:hypothetical protein